MEAYSSSVNMLPVSVGGLVGQIFRPGDGRFVGGCAAIVRSDRTVRHAGGCVGRIAQLAPQRFVGGCVGFAGIGTFPVAQRSALHDRARHAASATWGKEAFEAARA